MYRDAHCTCTLDVKFYSRIFWHVIFTMRFKQTTTVQQSQSHRFGCILFFFDAFLFSFFFVGFVDVHKTFSIFHRIVSEHIWAECLFLYPLYFICVLKSNSMEFTQTYTQNYTSRTRIQNMNMRNNSVELITSEYWSNGTIALHCIAYLVYGTCVKHSCSIPTHLCRLSTEKMYFFPRFSLAGTLFVFNIYWLDHLNCQRLYLHVQMSTIRFHFVDSGKSHQRAGNDYAHLSRC